MIDLLMNGRDFGLKTLKEIIRGEIYKMSDSQQAAIVKGIKECERLERNDFFYQLFCQRHNQNSIGIEESFSTLLWVSMIKRKDIYMSLLPVNDWAKSNRHIKQNEETLKLLEDIIEVEIKNDNQGSDGTLMLKKETIFHQLIYNDIKKVKKIKKFKVKPGLKLELEIGSNNIVKGLFQLMLSGGLARFSYPIKNHFPCISLFLFTGESNIYNFESIKDFILSK